MPGAISESRFDNWYAEALPTGRASSRNEICVFTETALYRYATPLFPIPPMNFPRTTGDLRVAQTMYTTPWEGGWWHLKDAVDYMVCR